MRRFFIEPKNITGSTAVLAGTEERPGGHHDAHGERDQDGDRDAA